MIVMEGIHWALMPISKSCLTLLMKHVRPIKHEAEIKFHVPKKSFVQLAD